MQMFRLLSAVWLWLSTAAVVAASESASAEGEGAKANVFEGDFWISMWTLLWFALLLIVLWKIAWKPLLKSLQARQDHIQKEIDDAEKARKHAQQVLDEYKSKLADSDRQGQEIIAQRTKQAQIEAKEVENQNRRQIEQMKQRFEADIEREKIDAQEQLWHQAGEIVQKIGQEVFAKTLDDNDNKRLIQQAIDKLKQTQASSAG